MEREERLERIERTTDVPLLILALAMVPLLLAPFVFDLSESVENAIVAADWFIWAAFAADLGVKLAVAPARTRYLREHWLEVAIVVLPFLRPLRAARLLRSARVLAVVGLNFQLIRSVLINRGTGFVLAMVLLISVSGAAIVLEVERSAKGANITTFGDALWWSITTMTTVGYGDRFPTTAMGRGIAVVLMLFGIAALSAFTAVVAAYLVKEDRDNEQLTLAEIREELRALRGRLDAHAQVDEPAEEVR